MASPERAGVILRTRTIARHLALRGWELESAELARFLQPRLAHLSNPEHMADRALAAGRLARAVRESAQIVVFGDYDCDGMTATAILTEGLRALGARSVVPLLASRFDGGYGLSLRALERVLAAEPDLVVTCDCGSSDHESLEVLRERGIEAIVIDHHLVPERPLPVHAFLNPHRPECEFPYKGLASCGLALSVLAAVRAELGAELDVRAWLDLVAIGTIADVAPLDGDNRALVRAGLTQIARAERPGLLALCDVIGIDRQEPLSAQDVAFRIAPRLNAPGRLGAPDLALSLLIERDPERARALALEIEHVCQTRRERQKSIEEQAEEDAEKWEDAPALVLGREGWNHGIVGIVAGRLAEKKKRPTIVIGFEGDVGRGSVRGPEGFPLFDALAEASAALVRFGGHQAAAGLEVRRDELDRFRELFAEACRARANYEAPALREPLDVDESDSLQELLVDLAALEPCGQGNPAPELRLTAAVRSARSVKGGHLKLELEWGRVRVGVFGPGLGELAIQLGRRVCVSGQLRADRYRGGDAVELLASRVESLGESP